MKPFSESQIISLEQFFVMNVNILPSNLVQFYHPFVMHIVLAFFIKCVGQRLLQFKDRLKFNLLSVYSLQNWAESS